MSEAYVSELSGTTLGVVRSPVGQNLVINAHLDARCGNGALRLPNISTAQRPANPTRGMIAWNTDVNQVEVYNGAGWQPVTTASTLTAGMAATG